MKKFKVLGMNWEIPLYNKIKKLADKETEGRFSTMVRKLCLEALEARKIRKNILSK